MDFISIPAISVVCFFHFLEVVEIMYIHTDVMETNDTVIVNVGGKKLVSSNKWPILHVFLMALFV